MRHRKFLNELEQKKNEDRENQLIDEHMQQLKAKQVKEQAAKQREKIKTLKNVDGNSMAQPNAESLTVEAVEKMS